MCTLLGLFKNFQSGMSIFLSCWILDETVHMPKMIKFSRMIKRHFCSHIYRKNSTFQKMSALISIIFHVQSCSIFYDGWDLMVDMALFLRAPWRVLSLQSIS